MLTKTKLALAAVLVAGTASLAMAQDADPNLLNRYPAYNGAHGVGDAAEIQLAPRGTFQSSPVRLETTRQFRSAPVRLQSERGTYQSQRTQGAGRLPSAFQEQQQPEFPQSPPGGGY